MFQMVPPHIRKGLVRLYVAVAVPWLVWFGYQAAFYVNQSGYSASARQHLQTSILLFLLVPVGAPFFLKLILWIIQGFASPKMKETAKAAENSKPKGLSIGADVDQLRIKVAEDLARRPDLLANKYLRTGWISGKHFREWQRLDETKLSVEQKAKLPPSYYEEGGIDPDKLAPLFAYGSGEHMVDHLIKLQERISASGSLENYFDQLVDDEIIKRLKMNKRRPVSGRVS